MKRFAFIPFLVLACFVLASFLAAGLGGWATGTSIRDWYPSLEKPGFNPPNWVFGPVWTTLYVLMAVAAWRVWSKGGWPAQKRPLALYFVQLALNTAWSFFFFGLRSPLLGLLDIVVLWILILLTLVSFWRADKVAGFLFAPYLLWVSYAGILNGWIWWLNR